MIFTTPDDKREQEKSKQKSLTTIKWKLKTKCIFNLKSFGTVAILKSKSTETKDKPGQQNSDYVHVQSFTIWIKLQVQLAAVWTGRSADLLLVSS